MRRPSSILVFKATCAILVFLVFGQVSLFFLCRCGRLPSEDDDKTILHRDKKAITTRHDQEKDHLVDQIQQMRKQIAQFQEQDIVQNSMIKKLGRQKRELLLLIAGYQRAQKATFTQELPVTKPSTKGSDFLKGERLHSEFEVIPFDSFSFNAIYQIFGGLSRNPAERPFARGTKGKDYSQIVTLATKSIEEEFEMEDTPTSEFDLVDGIMRIDRLKGSEYDLYFRTSQMNVYHRVKAVRPFQLLQLVGNVETIDTNHDIINLIIPLSGHLDKFNVFMNNFINICIHWDRRVFLTVVFFGQEGREELQSILLNISKSENYTNYKILFSDEPFSRGLGLQKGALDWDRGNVLMFFCDVDIHFTVEFLERCRFYTNPGHQVYYPILFSLYNPTIVYGGSPPPIREQFKVNKETGYWRDYGFGMVCQYRSDFLNTGGFDLSIKGWGKEDVKLYRQYLYSELTVIRAVDKGIFHIYHHKHCSRDLTGPQYIACINTKVKSEASQTQLGLLAFGGRIFGNDDPNWIEQLQLSAPKNPDENPSPTPKREQTAAPMEGNKEQK